MKKFNVAIFSLIFLCVGFFCAACGEKKQNFNVDKIKIDESVVFEYDGSSHATEITYNGERVNVEYALAEDSNNFKSLKDLDTKNVGSYSVFYKLSKKGFNDYYSNKAIRFSVVPKELEVDVFDHVLMKSDIDYDPDMEIGVGYTSVGHVPGDNLGLKFDFGYDFNPETVEHGNTYTISCRITNPNYVLISDTATMVVKDYVSLMNSSDEFVGYFGTIQEAIDAAEANSTLVLNQRIIPKTVINVNKSITIDGKNQHDIIPDQKFSGIQVGNKTLKSIFNISNTAENSFVELTLKNVTINGGKRVRGVSAFEGKVIIDNAIIRNGLQNDDFHSGGVFISENASLEMISGKIVDNATKDYKYTKYSADLWVGASASDTQVVINSGEVTNIFVNGNENSATGAGKLVLNGGSIKNVYLEYAGGYGAMCEYNAGQVRTFMVSKTAGNGSYQIVKPVEGTTYTGGVN